jgi:PDGLE domain
MKPRISMKLFVVLALSLAVGLGLAASPYASPSPDGLEKVAEKKGFLDEGRLSGIQEESPVPDYAFPGIEDPRLATGVAGFAGTLGVFAIAYGLGWVLRRRGPAGPRAPDPSAPSSA